jgi:hypothetical protein
MGFSEHLAECVVSSDLQSKDSSIRDVEFVAALSGASSLGADLLRAKDYDAKALKRAILALSARVRKRLKLSMSPAQLLSTTAIFELMQWQCRDCWGASEQIIGGIRVTCPTCGGVGVHRWSDKDRANTSGFHVETWHKWAKKYEIVLSMARGHDGNTEHAARVRLG